MDGSVGKSPVPDVGNPQFALISEPEAFDCGIWT